ncbi:MAG: flagellar filament capping protein FliD, partial [Myxococcota bacterium]|nr:flagellar filament capping protein FliD [Myxococcota bacterium]
GSDTISSLSELGLDSNEKTGILSFNPMKLSELMRDDPTSVERVLTRFGERLNGNFTYHRRTSESKPGTYDVQVTQARTRALVTAGAPAEALAANEDITVQFNRRAQANNNHADLTVNLQAGDSPDQQVTRINEAISAQGFDLTAFLDTTGRINIRANEYGDDYFVSMQSSLGGAAGTSRIGDAVTEDTGTDLEGRLGGVVARVMDGNHLKGPNGYNVEGVEVIIPDDVSGHLGQVRIVDGLAETVPDIIDALTGTQGVLRSRTDGLSNRISDLETEIIKQQDRIQTQETRLRRQFTRMEVTLGKLDALEQYITQQLTAMNNSNKKK